MGNTVSGMVILHNNESVMIIREPTPPTPREGGGAWGMPGYSSADGGGGGCDWGLATACFPQKSNSEHYCAPCRQYFQTHQAKREHLLGAKHKQTMANSTHQSSAQDIALTIPIFVSGPPGRLCQCRSRAPIPARGQLHATLSLVENCSKCDLYPPPI